MKKARQQKTGIEKQNIKKQKKDDKNRQQKTK